MQQNVLFTLGLLSPLVAYTLLPLEALATSCAFPFTGERAQLTPTTVTVGEPGLEEEADLQPYAVVTWTIESDIGSEVRVTIKNNESTDSLYLRAE